MRVSAAFQIYFKCKSNNTNEWGVEHFPRPHHCQGCSASGRGLSGEGRHLGSWAWIPGNPPFLEESRPCSLGSRPWQPGACCGRRLAAVGSGVKQEQGLAVTAHPGGGRMMMYEKGMMWFESSMKIRPRVTSPFTSIADFCLFRLAINRGNWFVKA